MDILGIRELKSHLSRYVARASAGERIIITVRGKQVAEIVPISAELQTLSQLAQQGRVTWSGRRAVFCPVAGYDGRSVSEAVLDQRDERERAVLDGGE